MAEKFLCERLEPVWKHRCVWGAYKCQKKKLTVHQVLDNSLPLPIVGEDDDV